MTHIATLRWVWYVQGVSQVSSIDIIIRRLPSYVLRIWKESDARRRLVTPSGPVILRHSTSAHIMGLFDGVEGLMNLKQSPGIDESR